MSSEPSEPNVLPIRVRDIDSSKPVFSLVHPDPEKRTMAIRVNPRYGLSKQVIVPDVPTVDGQTWSPKESDTKHERHLVQMGKESEVSKFTMQASKVSRRLGEDGEDCSMQAEMHWGINPTIAQRLTDAATAINGAKARFSAFVTNTFDSLAEDQRQIMNNIKVRTKSVISQSTRLTEREQQDLMDKFGRSLDLNNDSEIYVFGQRIYALALRNESDPDEKNYYLTESRKFKDDFRKLGINNRFDDLDDNKPSKLTESRQALSETVKGLYGPRQSIPTTAEQWRRLVDLPESKSGYDLDTFQELPAESQSPVNTWHSGPPELIFGFLHNPDVADDF